MPPLCKRVNCVAPATPAILTPFMERQLVETVGQYGAPMEIPRPGTAVLQLLIERQVSLLRHHGQEVSADAALGHLVAIFTNGNRRRILEPLPPPSRRPDSGKIQRRCVTGSHTTAPPKTRIPL